MTRKQHFVTFDSPGTFFHESSTLPIEAWDTAMAVSMAKSVDERYGSHPFGFSFSTSIVADPVDDGQGGKLEVQPKQIAKSGMHFIGGTVRSYADVVAADDPKEKILRSNMDCNRMWYVVTTSTPWQSTNPFNADSVTVDPETGNTIERGDSPERIGYRAEQDARKEQEYAAMRG